MDEFQTFKGDLKSTVDPECLISINVSFEEEKNYLRLSDYFTHNVRMKANFLDNPSPYHYFQEHREDCISEIGEVPTYDDFDEWLFSHTKMCSTFPVTVVKIILDKYKPQNVFDPSAGWGDRMLACISAGIPYIGVDPNQDLISGYQKMIEFFDVDPSEYQLITLPIEELPMAGKPELSPTGYDMILTSPPFFNMEKYSSDPTQSGVRYPSYESWKRMFLYPMLRKTYRLVSRGGRIVIYVNNIKKYPILEDTKFYMTNMKELTYEGYITWQNTKYPKKLLVWRRNP